MKKIILFLLFAVLCCYGSLGLVIEPEIQTVELFTDVSKNFYVNITNNFNEDIYFVTLQPNNKDIFIIDNRLNISKNETLSFKGVVDTNLSYEEETEIEVYFFIKTGVVNKPTQETVNISYLQFEPDIIEVFKGSTITWRNVDTIKHSVTSTLFDKELNEDDSFEYSFNEIGIYEYQDKFTTYTGQIIVKDIESDEYVHNPLNDTSFKIHIKSKTVDTTLSLEAIENNWFNITVNDNEDAVLSIENTGAKTANKVTFKDDMGWISFGDASLYIEAGKKKYIPYTIMPAIFYSNQTDKTYNITIIAQGENTLEHNTTISVYIPYKENVDINDTTSLIFNQTFSPEFLLALHNTICQIYPDYPVCKPSVIEKIVYKSVPIPYNFTQEDVRNYLRQNAEIQAQMERFMKDTSSQINSISDGVANTEQNSAETKNTAELLLQETRDEKESTQKKMWILYVIFFSVLFLGIGIYYMIEIRNKIDYDNQFKT